MDLVETLSVTYTPSGRPLAAFANGSIAFTSKVSGVPDLLLTLTTGGAGSGGDRGEKVRRTMERPVFHPCVRLARWREHGEISFVPPDGRFVLAGYEVDLLDASGSPFDAKASNLNLPASIEVKTGLGAAGLDFEVRLNVNHRFASSRGGGGAAAASLSNHLGRPNGLRTTSGDAKTALMEDVVVLIPIPAAVRNVSDLRPSKGEAHWSPGDTAVEWRLSGKEVSAISSAGALLRCSVVGAVDDDEDVMVLGNGIRADTYDYDEETTGAYQSGAKTTTPTSTEKERGSGSKDSRKTKQNAMLMPTSASLSFSSKGWLASGLRVDGLIIDMKKSKGVGEGVRPYKGVKYLTVSKGGVEVRC